MHILKAKREKMRFEGCQVIAQDHPVTVFYQIYDTTIILNTIKKEKKCCQLNYDPPSIARLFPSQRCYMWYHMGQDPACSNSEGEALCSSPAYRAFPQLLLNFSFRITLKRAGIISPIFREGNRFIVGEQFAQSHIACCYNRIPGSYLSISPATSCSLHSPQ